MKLRLLITVLWIISLACRPVITVGWWEMAIVGLLVALLAAPPLLRLYRRLVEFKRWRKNQKGDREIENE
ncbi:MAG: hypothetical protein U9Q82_03430 [Chloroflexota bacterium]|nr:hypothetical protein [Chloroflexota bacterium]